MIRIFIILSFFLGYVTGDVHAEVEGTRVNLSSAVIPLIKESKNSGFLSGGELFADRGLTTRGEFEYSIRLRNQTDDPIDASSLILVIDRIIGLAQGHDVMKSVEILGSDGITPEGKPFFQVPVDSTSELGPHAESQAVEVRIRNPNLLRLAMPSFQVWGIRKTESQKIQELGQVLIRKGILTPEEAAKLLDPSSVPAQP